MPTPCASPPLLVVFFLFVLGLVLAAATSQSTITPPRAQVAATADFINLARAAIDNDGWWHDQAALPMAATATATATNTSEQQQQQQQQQASPHAARSQSSDRVNGPTDPHRALQLILSKDRMRSALHDLAHTLRFAAGNNQAIPVNRMPPGPWDGEGSPPPTAMMPFQTRMFASPPFQNYANGAAPGAAPPPPPMPPYFGSVAPPSPLWVAGEGPIFDDRTIVTAATGGAGGSTATAAARAAGWAAGAAAAEAAAAAAAAAAAVEPEGGSPGAANATFPPGPGRPLITAAALPPPSATATWFASGAGGVGGAGGAVTGGGGQGVAEQLQMQQQMTPMQMMQQMQQLQQTTQRLTAQQQQQQQQVPPPPGWLINGTVVGGGDGDLGSTDPSSSVSDPFNGTTMPPPLPPLPPPQFAPGFLTTMMMPGIVMPASFATATNAANGANGMNASSGDGDGGVANATVDHAAPPLSLSTSTFGGNPGPFNAFNQPWSPFSSFSAPRPLNSGAGYGGAGYGGAGYGGAGYGGAGWYAGGGYGGGAYVGDPPGGAFHPRRSDRAAPAAGGLYWPEHLSPPPPPGSRHPRQGLLTTTRSPRRGGR